MRNSENLIRAAIDSIINQNYPNFNIYLVLDSKASKGTKIALKEFAKNKKIKIIQDKKRGSESQRNLGVKK